MNTYLAVKWLHILSATILFGTGLGTAFFMWRAMASNNIQAIDMVSENVVMADTWFTTPAVIVQPLSGIWLAHLLGLPLGTRWILLSFALFVLVGCCWIPVLFIQHRVARRTRELANRNESVSEDVHRLMRYWYGLGWPAFIAMLAIFYLMVFKPVLA
ncbi:DUF2269 family protein [Wenzhouxiangella sp. EGI_FJ10409]|uniref:DUF2269 family protein n=1 Tax=Wenzhouxiangella sp. EGI_FJ10409 TaxID=3243767 RepID=UPI0035E05EBD